jgi:hypothetical protein
MIDEDNNGTEWSIFEETESHEAEEEGQLNEPLMYFKILLGLKIQDREYL